VRNSKATFRAKTVFGFGVEGLGDLTVLNDPQRRQEVLRDLFSDVGLGPFGLGCGVWIWDQTDRIWSLDKTNPTSVLSKHHIRTNLGSQVGFELSSVVFRVSCLRSAVSSLGCGVCGLVFFGRQGVKNWVWDLRVGVGGWSGDFWISSVGCMVPGRDFEGRAMHASSLLLYYSRA
jgi:hypothetical protein